MKLTVPALALASMMLANQSFAESGPEHELVAAPFQQGLSRQMREAAQHLRNGERYDAMMALNGARHLAEATTSARSMLPDAMRAFNAAEATINAARAVVQNGRPEHAPKTLEDGADALEQANLTETETLDSATLAKASGQTALDNLGRTIGSVRSVSPGADGGFKVRLSSGGLFGIGAAERTLNAPAVAVGDNYVVIAGGE